jgi:hypothetical protein
MVNISSCEISNKNQAIKCSLGKSHVSLPAGTSNATLYRVESGGTIKRRSAGTITGTIVSSIASGGVIVNPSGQSIGT